MINYKNRLIINKIILFLAFIMFIIWTLYIQYNYFINPELSTLDIIKKYWYLEVIGWISFYFLIKKLVNLKL
jgi:hypothetical protein